MGFAVLIGIAEAEFARPESNSARSLSGQFIVRFRRGPEEPKAITSTTNQNLIRLEPTLVAVSCERIKQLLYHELGAGTVWRGKIFLTLYPSAGARQPVTILTEKLREGWQYSVELPSTAERVQYVRAIVRVLLLEFANRRAGARSAEIPAWLGEGFTQQLLAAKESQIILQPPSADPSGRLTLVSANVSVRLDSPLEQAHKKLQGRPLLSFDELSWPVEEQWSGDAGAEDPAGVVRAVGALGAGSERRARRRALRGVRGGSGVPRAPAGWLRACAQVSAAPPNSC